jgi:hypothetical protein
MAREEQPLQQEQPLQMELRTYGICLGRAESLHFKGCVNLDRGCALGIIVFS